MTDADTPRVPNFWWCPTHHLYRGGDERPCVDAVKLGDVEAAEHEAWQQGWEAGAAENDHLRSELAGMEDMAVKMRDFNARQFETLHSMILKAIGLAPDTGWPGNDFAAQALERITAREAEAWQGLTELRRERDALRADIRAVLDDFGQLGEPGRPNQTTALEALERIDARLDPEPGREENTATGHSDSEAYVNSQNTGNPYVMGPQRPPHDPEAATDD